MKFAGSLTADIIETRFAFSGKVVSVSATVGQHLKAWSILASLDRKPLQTELDRQLADYNSTRAQFDKSAKGTVEQARLDISVKDVELAHYKLDQADLVCPVEGMVLDMGGLAVGLNVTPASNPVKIIDTSSFRIVFKVLQKDLAKFMTPQKGKIKFSGIKETFEGESIPPFLGTHGAFEISVPLNKIDGLVVGMNGEISL